MKRALWALGALVLAVALLVAGVLGPFQPDSSRGTPAVAPQDAAALAAPAADGAGLDQTIVTLQENLRSNDQDWRSFASIGLAYLQKARLTADPSYYSKAEEALRRSLELGDDDNYQALLGMSVLAAARHDFEGALRWSRRARSANPYNADVRAVMGDALVELGRYRVAGQTFQKMIDLRPDLSTYARVSYFKELHGDFSGAVGAMQLALESSGAPEDAAWAGYQLGELYFGAGRLGPAERRYRRGASLAPDYALPKVGLAKVAATRGHFAQATRLLGGVVEVLPVPEYVILLGDIYTAAGDLKRAREQYSLVRAIQDLYRANGVQTDLEMALFEADHDIDVAGALRRARSQYQVRRSVAAADVMAWTLHANGRFEEALDYSNEALRLGTRNALFYFHRGMIQLRLGRSSEARSDLERALVLNPNFSFLYSEDARQTLERLESGAR